MYKLLAIASYYSFYTIHLLLKRIEYKYIIKISYIYDQMYCFSSIASELAIRMHV